MAALPTQSETCDANLRCNYWYIDRAICALSLFTPITFIYNLMAVIIDSLQVNAKLTQQSQVHGQCCLFKTEAVEIKHGYRLQMRLGGGKNLSLFTTVFFLMIWFDFVNKSTFTVSHRIPVLFFLYRNSMAI